MEMEWQKLVSHALQRASTALPGQILGEARASMPQWFRRPCLYFHLLGPTQSVPLHSKEHRAGIKPILASCFSTGVA